MIQALQPGELSGDSVENIRRNFQLRQTRGGGFGYLLDAEATWLLDNFDPTNECLHPATLDVDCPECDAEFEIDL